MDQSTIDVVKSTIMLMTEPKPSSVEAIFLHNRGTGDGDECIDLTAQAYHSMAPRQPLVLLNSFNGIHPKHGRVSEGYQYYDDRLNQLGVVQRMATRLAIHTRIENEAFLETARAERIRSAYIICLPPHILRAMMGMVKVMQNEQYMMQIWALTPPTIDWDKLVAGSAGSATLPRVSHIAGEISRIEEYMAKGDLCTFPELYDYLGRRAQLA